VRLRRRAAVLALGAGVLYLIGTNAQAGWLFVLAVLFLGAVGAGALLPIASLRRLDVEIAAPEEARQGSPTAVDVRITNRGRATRWGLIAHDEHLGGATTWVGAVRPGETVVVGTVRDAPRRGEAHPGWVELRSAAPFGVAERRRRSPVGGTTLVLPRTVPIPEPGFIEASLAREPSVRTEPRRGPGPEYLGVREYRAGDPIRQIHWRLSARHGELVVRDLEEERMPRLAIWVDTSGDDEALDACCTVAASIVDAATATGAGVRLGASTADGPTWATRLRAIDLHRWLARLGPSDLDAVTALDQLDGEALRGIGTLVVVVAGMSGGLDAAAARVSSQVSRTVIVPIGDDAELEREPIVGALLASGAEVVPWIEDHGLSAPILRVVGVSV